jgi:hypothetical protein
MAFDTKEYAASIQDSRLGCIIVVETGFVYPFPIVTGSGYARHPKVREGVDTGS